MGKKGQREKTLLVGVWSSADFPSMVQPQTVIYLAQGNINNGRLCKNMKWMKHMSQRDANASLMTGRLRWKNTSHNRSIQSILSKPLWNSAVNEASLHLGQTVGVGIYDVMISNVKPVR